ncbi:hypothetical protein APSETT444_005333 [Aspergillus pseudonomiae]
MAPRRHNIGASRRKRRDEEGEDEGSIDGELEDDSLSDGSGISNPDDDDADGEGSDDSDDDVVSTSPQVGANGRRRINGRVPETNQELARRHSASPRKHPLMTAVSDTEAMMNGLKILDESSDVMEVHFDDLKGEPNHQTERAPSAPPTEPKRDTFLDRKRREQERHIREKDESPVFVPTRGSFFLHDKRSTETVTNGHKPFNKSKSRPYGLIVDGNVRSTHVYLNIDPLYVETSPFESHYQANLLGISYLRQRDLSFSFHELCDPTNRHFEVVVVADSTEDGVLAFMQTLPTHRVSPSSFGKAPSQEGYNSPAGSVLSRHTMVTTENGKPVVRLPPPGRPPGSVGTAPQTTAGPAAAPITVPQPPPHPQPPNPVFRESRPAPIPMHQPRPQKAVSLADIETPARFPFNPPQPQQEQPFHHQVPVSANGSGYGPDASGHPPPSAHRSLTPTLHKQDRTFHAPSHMPAYQQAFWPASYPPGAIYYPSSGTEFPPYNSAVGPGPSVPPLPPGQQAPYVIPASHGSTEQPSLSGTVAHEAGGTVYFYDTTQMPPNSSYAMPAAPGIGAVMDMGAPPVPFYYYPYPQGGVYYPAQ